MMIKIVVSIFIAVRIHQIVATLSPTKYFHWTKSSFLIKTRKRDLVYRLQSISSFTDSKLDKCSILSGVFIKKYRILCRKTTIAS